MLLNETAFQAADTIVTDTAYQTVCRKLMNATVLLRGSGQDVFIGSGVILGAGKEVRCDSGTWSATTKQFTVIVSALHNLYVNGDKINRIPPLDGSDNVTWNQTYADNFAQQVKIEYGNGTGDMAWNVEPRTQRVQIDHVVPIFSGNIGTDGKIITIPSEKSADGKAFQLANLRGETKADGSGSGATDAGITPVSGQEKDSWNYDVVLLLSKDADLYDYATTGGKCDFMAGLDLKELADHYVVDWYSRDSVYTSRTPILGRNFRLLQLGYGKTQDSDVAVKIGSGKTSRPQSPTAGATFQKLQYKRALPLLAVTVDDAWLNTEHELPDRSELVLKNTGGLFFNCRDGNESTFSGDSGGPLAAIPVPGTGNAANAILAGINTGAGYALSETEARDKGVWEYDNNVATSLGLFYDKLYDLRFQNV